MRIQTRRSTARRSASDTSQPSWRRRVSRVAWSPVYVASRLPVWIARRAKAFPRSLLSVRMRLALWYLAILAIVFFVFGGIVYSATTRNAQTSQNADLVALSQQLLQRYNPTTGLLDVQDPFTSGPFSSGSGKSTSVAPNETPPLLGPDDIATLYDGQNNMTQQLGPLVGQGNSDLQDIVSLRRNKFGGPSDSGYFSLKLLVSDVSGKQLHVMYAIYLTTFAENGHSSGTLIVGRPSQADAALRSLIPGLLLAGPLTLLIAALGGYWVASRAMRPVRLITRTAQSIEETDLSRRLRLKRRDELGELAATFDHMLDRLEAAFVRQRQFTADASHELRTPLSVVDLEVTRGLAERRAPEEYERILATVRAENAHMTRLVEDLLALARADAGQAQWQMEPLDLSDVALEALERLAPLARERGVELVAGPLPELRVMGDRLALTRLVMNLIENGVKYGGGRDGRVTLTTGAIHERRLSWAWARVSDNGPGIAAEHLPHLFERFYQVDTARERLDSPRADEAETAGDSGLGLAIVRWIAEGHGGSVGVQSAIGQGSTFELHLPLLAGGSR